MRIASVLTPPTEINLQLAAQIGVSDFVCRYPRHYGLEPLDGLTQMIDQAAAVGLKLSVVEGYLPLDQIILGSAKRDEQIAELTGFVQHMGQCGVALLCYNFMLSDWTRTSTTLRTRGGAMTNGFDVTQLEGKTRGAGHDLTEDQLWANLGWFLERLIPVAEDAGVTLAMHPDDPPLPRLGGAAQTMYSPQHFDRLFELSASPANAMCFCQGTFAEMGVDIPATIRRFGDRIRYVHFRDVRGTAEQFSETFHDDGQTDMAAAMRAYRAIGFDGPMRPDHVPLLAGEDGDGSGYSTLGRLFAVGYMRGLMDATEHKKG